jgi:hypothetical protein
MHRLGENMSSKKLKDSMEKDLITITKLCDEAYAEFEDARANYEDLCQQKLAIRSALDVLGGKVPTSVSLVTSSTSPDKTMRWEPGPPGASQLGSAIQINGETVILEPGFKVSKNSLGEDCIVPDDFNPPPMSEPIRPSTPALTLPPIAGDAFVNDGPEGI